MLLVVGAAMLKRDPTLRNDSRIREKVRAVTRSLNGKRPGSRGLLEAVTVDSTGPYWEALPRAEAPGVRGDREMDWKTQEGSEWTARSYWGRGGWESVRGARGQTVYSRWSGNGWYGTPTGTEW